MRPSSRFVALITSGILVGACVEPLTIPDTGSGDGRGDASVSGVADTGESTADGALPAADAGGAGRDATAAPLHDAAAGHADVGASPKADTGAPPEEDAGSVLLDAGPTTHCAAGKTPCASNCCDDATQLCGDGACNPNPCNAPPQTACSGGKTCYPDVFSGGGEICAAPGAAAAGAPCTTLNGCVAGVGCYVSSSQTTGTCVKLCDPTAADSCPYAGDCESIDSAYGTCGCDPLAKTGCSSAQACYPDFLSSTPNTVSSTNHWCATPGTVAVGSHCTTFRTCVAGAACVLDSAGVGVCVTLCDPSASSCGASKVCRGVDSSIGACWCDVMAQTGCTGGQACYYFDGCRTPGAAAAGDQCVKDSDCAPGNICFPQSATTNVCLQLCHQGVAGSCPSPQTCTDAMTLGCPRMPTPPPVWVCTP